MDKREQLWESLKDKEYRQLFAEDVGTGLAFQIKLMREDRGWTQEQLAQCAGKAQETISQLENPDYGRHSLTTLKKLAAAFDVALIVRFARFGELVDWTTNITPDNLTPQSYDDEKLQLSFARVSGDLDWLAASNAFEGYTVALPLVAAVTALVEAEQTTTVRSIFHQASPDLGAGTIIRQNGEPSQRSQEFALAA